MRSRYDAGRINLPVLVEISARHALNLAWAVVAASALAAQVGGD